MLRIGENCAKRKLQLVEGVQMKSIFELRHHNLDKYSKSIGEKNDSLTPIIMKLDGSAFDFTV